MGLLFIVEKKKAISVLSGGLDSLVATAYYAKDYDIHALTFDYGQKAVKKEIEGSEKICDVFNMKHTVINLDWLACISDSALNSDKDIPTVENEDLDNPSLMEDTSKSVWVPGRNIVFTSIATSFAEAEDASIIIVGWDKEEAETFPDNSKEFLNSFNNMILEGSISNIEVKAPAIDLNKEEIVELGLQLNAPLGLSYSCYSGEDIHCGVCESCMRRKRAFEKLNINDPTVYKK